MLSRTADAIYWMNRYIERAENCARIIDVNLNLSHEIHDLSSKDWQPVVITTGDYGVYQNKFGETTKEKALQFLIWDIDNPNSIYSCIMKARENARTVQETISSEMWLQINQLYLNMLEHSDRIKGKATLNDFELKELLSDIKMGSHLFCGIMEATCSHNEGWHFGNIGRFIERADKTARIVDVKYFYLLPSVSDVGSPLDLLQWVAVLKSASGYEMYLKKYGNISVSHIVEFLTLDPFFPRSIYYSLVQTEKSLIEVQPANANDSIREVHHLIGRLKSEVEYTRIADIFKYPLHPYMDDMQTRLNEISAAIQRAYFDFKQETIPQMVTEITGGQ